MKRIIAVLGTFAALFVVAILWYRWDSGANHGYSWGYWGQFNTVSNALAKIPGVKIVKSGCNADVTMEEFGFEITTAEGHQVHVWFSETDPIRKLSGDALSKALQDKIKKESSNSLRSSPRSRRRSVISLLSRLSRHENSTCLADTGGCLLGNARSALQSVIARLWPGVPEPTRWATLGT